MSLLVPPFLAKPPVRCLLAAICCTLVGCGEPTAFDVLQDESAATSPGHGLRGSYFAGVSFDTLKSERIDPTIHFDWGSTTGPLSGLGPDLFSVRWTGQVQTTSAGEYTFATNSDDGVRLWVNGQQLIDNWTLHRPTLNTAKVTLASGQKYELKMEYFQNLGHALASLAWAPPGASLAVIPSSQLFPNSGATADAGSQPVDAGTVASDGGSGAKDAGTGAFDAGTFTPPGPVIKLSGTTSAPYRNGSVANNTTFELFGYVNNGVGTSVPLAFSVGANGPNGVYVEGGAIDGHIPLSWDWTVTHAYGGGGFMISSSGMSALLNTRIHNVEDGLKPREIPEWSGKATMWVRGAYMTGIRDDAIEDDDFMPGTIEDSLMDGVWCFLSEQNQGTNAGETVSPGEDPLIRINHVLVRLFTTNNDVGVGHWFKWQGRGKPNHSVVITDSTFAVAVQPRLGWDNLAFPPGTVFKGTNRILWLGAPGGYAGPKPAGVDFVEGSAAIALWGQLRNTWLSAHGYATKSETDLNPMDDPVIGPAH